MLRVWLQQDPRPSLEMVERWPHPIVQIGSHLTLPSVWQGVPDRRECRTGRHILTVQGTVYTQLSRRCSKPSGKAVRPPSGDSASSLPVPAVVPETCENHGERRHRIGGLRIDSRSRIESRLTSSGCTTILPPRPFMLVVRKQAGRLDSSTENGSGPGLFPWAGGKI